MNAATFRALRETTGMSQRTVADALGVTERAVKLWERGTRPVPKRVAAWMAERTAEHDRAVAQAVDATLGMVTRQNEALGLDETHRPPVTMSYFRTQADYDAAGRDEGDYGVVDARARAVAAALRGLGHEVEFGYPADGS